MRSPWTWIAAAVGGIVLVLVVTAMIGNRDDSDETVPAGAWAQNVCGAVGVWRGELEALVEDVRTPNANSSGAEEPQSETPQGRTGFVREGIERAIFATETLVDGVENAGVPDTEQGQEAAQLVDEWADGSKEALEDAQENLDEEADSLEDSIEVYTEAAAAIGRVLALGTDTLAEVARLDPALGAAVRDSSTCQELREEES
jgi:hypothetical protein